MSNNDKDYKNILSESLTNLDDRGADTHKIMKGSGKATVSLAMVAGDLMGVVDNTRKKLDELNNIISDYSKSSDNRF